MRRSAQRDGRDHRSRPRRRHLGAGLLLRVVRGPGRHQARGKLCARRRATRGGGAVSTRTSEYGLRLRLPREDAVLDPFLASLLLLLFTGANSLRFFTDCAVKKWLWLWKIVSGLAQMPRWVIPASGCLTS